MRTSDIKIRFEPPETWADDYPMGSRATTTVLKEEGLVFLFVTIGHGPMRRISFTAAGFERFAKTVAEEAAE